MFASAHPVATRRPYSQTAFDYRYSYRKLRLRTNLAREFNETLFLSSIKPELKPALPRLVERWQHARKDCDFLAKVAPDGYDKALRSMVARDDDDPLAKPFVTRFEDGQRW